MNDQNSQFGNTIEDYINAEPVTFYPLEILEDLNKDIGGGLPQNSWNMITAESGMGKTMFALNLAVSLALSGHKVAFFSAEVSNRIITERLLAIITNLDINMIKYMQKYIYEHKNNPDAKYTNYLTKINEAIDIYKKLNLKVFYDKSIEKICLKMEELIGFEELDVAFIDHIHCVTVEDTKQDVNDTVKTKYIVNTRLRPIWEKYKVAIVGLAQFKKDGGKTFLRTQEDVKGASDAYQLATNIFYLFESTAQEEENIRRDAINYTSGNTIKEPKAISLKLFKNREGGNKGIHFLDWHASKGIYQYNKRYIPNNKSNSSK